MKSRVLMYRQLKIIALALFIGLIIALPATAFPFSYTVISNEEIDWNHFKSVITMYAQPSVIGVKNALDAGKSNNIIIDSVTQNGVEYVIEGHLVSYVRRNNFLFNPWWNSSWSYSINNAIPDGSRPYQISLNISNSIGTNNATYVFCNGNCNTNFTDIRFTLDNTTSLPYWIENNTTGKVWVNVTANGTVNMYYGNPSAISASNGTNTFVAFDDFEGVGLLSWTNGNNAETWTNNGGYRKQTNTAGSASPYMKTSYINIPETNYIVHAKFKAVGSVGGNSRQGLVTEKTSGDAWYLGTIDYGNNANSSILDTAGGDPPWVGSAALGFTVAADTWYSIDMLRQPNVQKVSIRPIGSSISWTTQVTRTSLTNQIAGLSGGYDTEVWYDDFYVRNYATAEPTWATWGTEQHAFISSWGNNFTNDDDILFNISENKNINFNITKRYAADSINWYVDSVNQSNNFNNISVIINTVGTTNITAVVSNTTAGTSSVSWLVTLNINLVTPMNGSTIYSSYPPAAHAVIFAWTSTGYPFYNLLIGTDSNFNTVASSVYLSTETTSVYLLTGKQYFWKVRMYSDALTPGMWSIVSNFNLTANYSLPANTTGIYGVVYQKTNDGSLLPISDAVVSITNTTWSDLAISGTNGYYLFPGLKAGDVYTIRAVANGFEAGSTEYVNATLNWTEKNLFLQTCRSGFTCFYDQHFVRFTAQNIWFTKYAGVTASVYKGSELTVSDTKITGTDGSVNFLLIKDQQYRITFINTTQGISTTWTGYPSKTDYYIITDATTSSWDTHGTDAATTTDIEVTTQIINNTHAYVNVSYNDTLAGTSNLMFYLNKTIPGDANNQTVLQTRDGGINDQYNASFIVSGYGGNSYMVRVKADHSTYGVIRYSYGVAFPSLPSPLQNFDGTFVLMLFIGFILFISGMFGQTSSEQGSAIVVAFCWIFGGIGIFSAVNVGIGFYLALTLATIIVIIMNINARGRQEGLQ